MELFQQVKQYIVIIGVAIFVIIGIIAVIGIYFYKFYKAKVSEKQVDYGKFERRDATDFIKFDDICSNMIVTENKKRFIGAIRCVGFDYPYAEEEEKLQTMRGYISFFNLIDKKSIQYRQTAKSIDLDAMISDYMTQVKSIKEEQYLRTLDYEKLKEETQQDLSSSNYDLYYDKLIQQQREITSYSYQVKQLSAQIQYMQSLSGEKADPDRNSYYVFDWTYNPLEFSNELSEDAIYQKAERQLSNTANSYISALKHAGVKAYLMTGTELMEEIRSYTHPKSGEILKSEDIECSNYDSVVVSSESQEALEHKIHKNTLDEVLKELKYS